MVNKEKFAEEEALGYQVDIMDVWWQLKNDLNQGFSNVQ